MFKMFKKIKIMQKFAKKLQKNAKIMKEISKFKTKHNYYY